MTKQKPKQYECDTLKKYLTCRFAQVCHAQHDCLCYSYQPKDGDPKSGEAK